MWGKKTVFFLFTINVQMYTYTWYMHKMTVPHSSQHYMLKNSTLFYNVMNSRL